MTIELDELDAMQGMKNALEQIVPPPANGPDHYVYIWPHEYHLIPDTLVLPTILVMPGTGEGENFDYISYHQPGVEMYRWRIELLVYAAEGPITRLNEQAAEADMKVIGWKQKISGAILNDRTLGGNVLDVGRKWSKMLDADIVIAQTGTIYYGALAYWGIRATVPVITTRRHRIKRGVP